MTGKFERIRVKVPFGYKLMISYCVFIIIPVLLVGNIATQIFVTSIREQTHNNIQGTLHQMNNNITYKIEDIVRISDMLYFDTLFNNRLRYTESQWVSYDTMVKVLIPKLETAISTANRKIWMSIYLKNNDLGEVYDNYSNSDPLDADKRLFDIYRYDRLVDKTWYKLYPPEEEYGTTLQWKQIEYDAAQGRISLLRRLIDITTIKLQEIGFMRINVSLDYLFESMDYKKIGEGTALYLSDSQGRIILSSGGVKTTVFREKELRNNGDLLIREPIPQLGWELIAVVPAPIVEKDTVKIRNLTLLICLVCIVVFFVVSLIVSRYFSLRVSKIVSVLDSFQEGEFHKRAHFKGNDEFSHISSALNEMGSNIGRLINEVYLADLQKKEAELESLHAQINPHFLYNTLSSISRLARFGMLDKLHRMVLDLAKFYRLSLNDGRNIISVKNELEQAQAYVDIQKIKYDERMQVSYDVEPEVVRYETVKLILQPFIENVLEHAWTGDSIHIRITARVLQNVLEFRVIDNGVGFPPDRRLDNTGAQNLTNAGYGIRNVDQRIKLHYGSQYGVTLFSRAGIGTTVRIVIPLVKRKVSEGRDKPIP
ncbi:MULTISPECIES: cache domain-containing sensor histidine kinase [Paenibacillus]|uniref:Sensor histidine kinase YesM n=1 Tax=Paenibacillus lactis TaxID=228574 RepID=A0ABS4F7L6_9BACL|nr:sensor histidine kinase [Paenibacillus lactis]MBP1892255.1 sensor histidine kinase YesM [Paenibacillus lactis]HAG01198.1 two-component sensor histidine kinase [Paenibacillus lactis]